MYTLERLAAGDLEGAGPLVGALAAALGRLHKGAPEWAPFAATLARRLAVRPACRPSTSNKCTPAAWDCPIGGESHRSRWGRQIASMEVATHSDGSSRAQALLAAGRLAVPGPLWSLALEHILLRCVDTETQVLVVMRSHGGLGLHRVLAISAALVMSDIVVGRVQVHEEILRLLLAAAPRLDAAQLGRHLQSALQNSRKSRRCRLPQSRPF